MKLAGYYKHQGYIIKLIRLKYKAFDIHKPPTEINAMSFSKVFVSCIFDTNKDKTIIKYCDDVEYGGTGYDICKNLPQEIDDWPEDYSVYPGFEQYSYGFFTRGCIRKCPWCVVPKKEGYIYQYRTLEKIWRPGTKIHFLDNNILAFEGWKEIFQTLIDKNISCEFNQGLDIRLLTPEKVKMLNKLRYMGDYIFAFDHLSCEEACERGLKIWRENCKRRRLRFYIYCNANSPIHDDVVHRIEWVHSHHCVSYLMRDVNCYTSPRHKFYEILANYCNMPIFNWRNTFKEFAEVYHPEEAAWLTNLYDYG